LALDKLIAFIINRLLHFGPPGKYQRNENTNFKWNVFRTSNYTNT